MVLGVSRLRSRRAIDEGVDEERETVWSWSTWWRGIMAALRARFRRRHAPAAPSGSATRAPSPDSVRALYRTVLRWSRAHGRPRLMTETPSEFEPSLRDRLPAALGQHLTAAYTHARYGEHQASDSD
ncbi:MAG: DUF4129 domain-containing protein, partial [Singulisphaera sp.]|nr:DUF4129 domain-containing protein [Singulisphaera sp.]